MRGATIPHAWTPDFTSSRRGAGSSVRFHSPPTRAANRMGGAVYAFRPACMHPYASGDAYIFSSRFGLVPTFRGWSGRVYALYASFPYRGFEKREETPYIDAYNAYKRKEFYFFLYI